MDRERIRVGIVGASVRYGWGQRAHLPAILGLPEYELTAVCTAHPETAAESARHYGARHALHDYRELARHPDVDLVVVCVRAALHHDMVKAALEAGKHVLCEWPLGARLDAARELAALARQKRVHTMVGLQSQGSPAILHLRDLIADGYVGRPLACSMSLAIPRYPGYRTPEEWVADPEKGPRVLMIHAGHAIDSFCCCVGEFREVSGSITAHIPEPGAVRSTADVPEESPDAVIAEGVLQNGAVATISVTTNVGRAGGWRMEVLGTKGSIVATCPTTVLWGDVTLRGGKVGDHEMTTLDVPPGLRTAPETVPAGPPVNVAELYRRLAQGIREGHAVHPSFDDAVRRHMLLQAIEDSSRTGQRQIISSNKTAPDYR